LKNFEKSYAIMYPDAIQVKAKQEGKSRAKSVHVALRVGSQPGEPSRQGKERIPF
jgi:transposase-like protein